MESGFTQAKYYSDRSTRTEARLKRCPARRGRSQAQVYARAVRQRAVKKLTSAPNERAAFLFRREHNLSSWLPIFAALLVFQKALVRGLVSGAVKG